MPIQQSSFESLSKLEILARQVVEGFITGLHKSPFHGFSVEFAEHRQYNTGESTRHIDWKLYGRTEKLFTKRYEEETNLRCQLLIDQSASMHYPVADKNKPNDLNKIRFSTLASAAIMYLLRQQRDAVGLSLISDQIDLHTDVKSTRKHHGMLYEHLNSLYDAYGVPESKGSNLVESLHLLSEQMPRRSLVVLFTDMYDSKEQLDASFEAMQHLRYNKHELILFHVIHEADELDFDFEERPYKFVDLESKETLKLNPDQVKEAYASQAKAYRDELKIRCGQNGIEYVPAYIEKGFEPILLSFLLKRQKLY